MPFTGRALGALVMGFLLAAGCGGSTEEGGPGGTGGAPSVGPVSQQDFARVFASSACSSMASCCQANKFAYDYQVCKSSLEGQLQASLFRIQGLAVGYDAAAAGQCTGGVIEVLSACKGDAFASDSCDRIFV
ncbi:MAG TPA: hypothetical protein VGJ84_15960, partial [Polyangiaceae bacterium]